MFYVGSYVSHGDYKGKLIYIYIYFKIPNFEKKIAISEKLYIEYFNT